MVWKRNALASFECFHFVAFHTMKVIIVPYEICIEWKRELLLKSKCNLYATANVRMENAKTQSISIWRCSILRMFSREFQLDVLHVWRCCTIRQKITIKKGIGKPRERENHRETGEEEIETKRRRAHRSFLSLWQWRDVTVRKNQFFRFLLIVCGGWLRLVLSRWRRLHWECWWLPFAVPTSHLHNTSFTFGSMDRLWDRQRFFICSVKPDSSGGYRIAAEILHRNQLEMSE